MVSRVYSSPSSVLAADPLLPVLDNPFDQGPPSVGFEFGIVHLVYEPDPT